LALVIKIIKVLKSGNMKCGVGERGIWHVWWRRKCIQGFCRETGIKRPFGSHNITWDVTINWSLK